MQLLHVDSSILGANSASRELTADVVEAELRRVPGLTVVYRDVAAGPLGHISGEHLGAAQGAGLELPPELERDLALGRASLEEFLASDIVVVGAPMYNFTIPSQLKTWIDRIVVAGRTFKYGPEGIQGLAGGKKADHRLHAGRPVRPRYTDAGVRPPGDLPGEPVQLPGHHRHHRRACRRSESGRQPCRVHGRAHSAIAALA